MQRHPWWFVIGLMLITTMLAYGDALRLPFFFDDMTHYVWLRGHTLVSIFLTAAGRPYYRPMQYFLWKLYETLTGQDSVVGYHALTLIVHVVNATLVVLLVRQLTRAKDRWWPALLAGLIFTLFPFSYQVVTLPASFTHSMAALFTLLAILSYDRFRTGNRARWLSLSMVCAVLAFGSNEGTLLMFSLIGLTEFVRADPRRQWRWAGAFAVLGALYFLWYRSRPSASSQALSVHSLETIFQNAVYALQGLTFPVQPLSRVLMQWGLNDQVAVLAVGVPALIALAALYFRGKQPRQFLFSACWYAVCLIAPVLFLSHTYFIDAPRVFYLGSIGAAWLWANAVGLVADPIGSHVRLRQGLAVAFALGLLVPSFIFVRQRLALHDLNAAPLNQALDIARQSTQDANLLFVNLPAWISTPQIWYPIGHEGALFIPKYSSLADFTSTNLNRPSQVEGIEFKSLSTPEPYYFGVYGPALGWEELAQRVNQANRVYFTVYRPDQIEVVEAGHVTHAAGPASNALAVFGDATVLEKAEWSICRDRLNVTLDWFGAPGDTGQHVFVHVLNPDGSLAAQHDSPPMLGLRPFWQWAKGDRVVDVHPIDISQLPRDRQYAITVGLYDLSSGERLAPVLASGEQPASRAVQIGQFTIGALPDTCR